MHDLNDPVRRRRQRLVPIVAALLLVLLAGACTPRSAEELRQRREELIRRITTPATPTPPGVSPAPTTTAPSGNAPATTVATSPTTTVAPTPTTTTVPKPPVTLTPATTIPAPPPTVPPATPAPPATTTAPVASPPPAPAPGTKASAALIPPGPPAPKRTFTVAPWGSDTNPGSADAPWKSLSRAVSRLVPGDHLVVRGGRYEAARDEQFDIHGKEGSPDAWITIAAAPGERPVVQLNSFWQGFYVLGSSYVEIRGLEIVGTALTDQRMTDGIEFRDSHHVRAIGNVVRDTGGCGICSIGADNIVIADNEVSGASKWNAYQTSGISVFQSKNIGTGDDARGHSVYVVGNRAHHNTNVVKSGTGLVTDGNCIILDENNLTGYRGRILVANNVCYENGGRGIHVLKTSRVLVVNNTLVNNLRHADIDGGELTVAFTTDVVFRNNLTSAARSGKGIVNWDATGIVFDRNLHVGARPSAAGATDITAGAAIGADFRPTSTSPAIDAGSADRAPAVDVTGRSRTTTPDIGAFEVR